MSKLYLGGIRSGKSVLAENYCLSLTDQPISYVATARSHLADDGLNERIALHTERRDSEKWCVIEAQSDLTCAIQTALDETQYLLIDSIDMWLAGMDFKSIDDMRHYDAFLSWLASFAPTDSQHRLVIVSSETGLAPIANHPMTREFVDRLGATNQQIARQCSSVVLCVAGLEHHIK